MTTVKHLGIIMDGNRRWAQENNLEPYEGHQKGSDKLQEVGRWCTKKGIKVLTIYAFSTENWDRSQKEIDFLMNLISKAFSQDLKEFNKRGIRINVIGSKSRLSDKIIKDMEHVISATKDNKDGVLNICFNYGGRLEIVEAVQQIVKKGYKKEEINEELITKHTWMGEQENPDLIIRTSGEQRLSGFLTWQSIYSEFYFTKCHWPDFSEKDLDLALKEFEKRQRRFGGN